jgi:hypothetical protein
MRKIVEFMLTRMDTHPEEFLESKKQGVKHNWMGYYKSIKKFLSEEENKAIWGKLSEINLDETMSHITQKLLEPEDEELSESTFDAAIRSIKQGYITQGQATPSKIMISTTQLEMLKMQVEKQKADMKHHMDTYRYSMEGRYESSKDNG